MGEHLKYPFNKGVALFRGGTGRGICRRGVSQAVNMQNEDFKRRNYRFNPKLKLRARELRNNMTAAENKLWIGCLRQFSVKVYRQKPIGNYIVDFYVPKLKLVIELDGETHIENKEIKYDKNRTKELEKLGLKVARFWNYDILDNSGGFDAVCEKIYGYL
jgi:very-short-patch-repair endonuclease